MKRDPRFSWGFVAVAVVALVGFAVLAPALIASSGEPCCFANDRYEGICTVIPGEGETCQDILGYLNNPMSTGKTYCGNTKVRGGWIQVDCQTGKSAGQPRTTGSTTKAQRPAPAHADRASR